jgi:hypothetical protein
MSNVTTFPSDYEDEYLPLRPVEGPEVLVDKVELEHSVTVYVPSATREHNPIPFRKVQGAVDRIAEELTGVCGGATVTQGVGYWRSGDGKVGRETVRMITSYTDDIEEAARVAVRQAEWLREEFDQECVSLEVDNRLYFV